MYGWLVHSIGLPWWLRRYRICLQCQRPGFDPWVGKMPWRRAWQPTPVCLPGEPHEQRSLVGTAYGVSELDTPERLKHTSSAAHFSEFSSSSHSLVPWRHLSCLNLLPLFYSPKNTSSFFSSRMYLLEEETWGPAEGEKWDSLPQSVRLLGMQNNWVGRMCCWLFCCFVLYQSLWFSP